ncbi:MAG: ABC transporter substrate-binding protein [Rhizobiales bacterium]|nr:ABC transporter substrate-binding protein [Hyphomicrobiales bacterium]
MPNRRHVLQGIGGGLASLAAPRLGSAQAARTLRFIPNADLAILDPVWTLAYVTRNHACMVFDTLYGIDDQFQPQPQMVAGHQVDDEGRRWRLTLRDGLVFHDGSPVLARDCVASIRRWGQTDSVGRTLMALTEEVSAPSDKLIEFRLKRPFPLLPMALGKASPNMLCVMPERLAETPPQKQVTEMIGSGPFRFLAGERVAGSFAAYAKFDKYVPAAGPSRFLAGGKHVHFDRVEWRTMPDVGTAAAALQAGEVDWWEAPSADLLPLLARNRNIALETIDATGSIGVIRINHANPPFDNPAILRAVLGAIDQSEFMMAVAGDDRALWNDKVGLFTPGTPMATEAGVETLTGPRNIDRVKRDLAAAGYKGERVVLLGASDIPPINAMSQVAQAMFSRIGMNVDFISTDWGTVMQRRASNQPVERGGWSAFVGTWSGYDMLNPAVSVTLRGDGNAAGGWLKDPEIERLRSAWFDAPDLAGQQAVCRALQEQALRSVPYIPLGQFRTRTAIRRNIVDLPKGIPAFWGLRRGA